MTSNVFEVLLLPDPANEDDFALRWHGYAATERRAGAYAMATAAAVSQAFSCALGNPQSPRPSFISAQHRKIRPEYGDSGTHWTINLQKFNIHPNSKINADEFLLSNHDALLDMLQYYMRFMSESWGHLNITLGMEQIFSPKMKQNLLHISFYAQHCSAFNINNDYNNSIIVAIGLIVIAKYSNKSAFEAVSTITYSFPRPSGSATLRAAHYANIKANGEAFAEYLRDEGYDKLARKFSAIVSRAPIRRSQAAYQQ